MITNRYGLDLNLSNGPKRWLNVLSTGQIGPMLWQILWASIPPPCGLNIDRLIIVCILAGLSNNVVFLIFLITHL